MNETRSRLVLGIIALCLASTACAEPDERAAMAPEVMNEFHIPFSGHGHLVSLWSVGRNELRGPRVVVYTHAGTSQPLHLDWVPLRTRWRSASELVVEQLADLEPEGIGSRIVRLSPIGEVRRVLADPRSIGGIELAPSGEQIAFFSYEASGAQTLEIHQVEPGLRLIARSGSQARLLMDPIWSPDGSRIAVGLWESTDSDPSRLLPRLAVSSVGEISFVRVGDEVPGEMPPDWSVVPAFWTHSGIYATSPVGLILCDENGGGCRRVYSPGKDLQIVTARSSGPGSALLLVRDLSADPLEIRATEVHEVELDTGVGRVLVRAPRGTYVTDLDWISGD